MVLFNKKLFPLRSSTPRGNAYLNRPYIFEDPLFYSTLSSEKINFTFNERTPMFSQISLILNSEVTEKEKQMKIERTLRYFWKEKFEELISNSSFSSPKYGLNIFIKEYKLLSKEFIAFLNKKSTFRHKSYMRIVKDLDSSLTISIILSRLIPFLIKFKDIQEQNVYVLYEKIGKDLFLEYALHEYKEYKSNKDYSSEVLLPEETAVPLEARSLSFKEFKAKLGYYFSDQDIITLGFALLSIMEIFSSLFTSRIITKNNESTKYYLPSEELLEILNGVMINDIVELPMVCCPEEWQTNEDNSISLYGGYLLNNMEYFRDLVKKSPENPESATPVSSNIIDSINYMSSIPYAINTKVLEILLEDKDLKPYLESLHKETKNLGNLYKIAYKYNGIQTSSEGDTIPNIKDVEAIPNIKDIEVTRAKEKISEITEFNSKFYYVTNIINIAKLYAYHTFYFDFYLDWRGRIYSQSGSLNFQAGDFAKSLLLFNNGSKLDKEGLISLKYYIANLFGKDKLSHNQRIEWVEINLNKILDIDSEFWKTADEPYTALAASLELRDYLSDPDNFISRLPVLLDATCNGLQHLAAMSKDINLAKKVNLLASSSNIDPEDCYSMMVEPVKAGVKDLVEREPKYANLSKLIINRILVKRPIMTISYGVTIKGISDQLIKEHFTSLGKINDITMYQSNKKVGDVILSFNEIYMLSTIIYKSLFIEHPMLNELVNYLRSMVKLLNSLNLPIVWLTPSGLLITQKYMKFESERFTTKIFSKRKTLTLRRIKHENINKLKQVNAFIPNFIHSLDASNIALLIKEILQINNSSTDKLNILTIHDCFGTSANNANKVSYLVKNAFLQIYSNPLFLNMFHEFILDYIKKNNLELNESKSVVFSEGNTYPIPTMPKLGVLDLKDQLPNSIYFIN